MAHPLVLALGAAAAGAFLMNQSQKAKEAREREDAARVALLGRQATELEAGNTYTMKFLFMPEKAGGLKGVAAQSSLIQATFEQLGFKPTLTPQPATPAAKAAAEQNQTAEWLFAGVWRRRDKKFIDTAIPWLGQSMLFQLPVQPDMSAVI